MTPSRGRSSRGGSAPRRAVVSLALLAALVPASAATAGPLVAGDASTGPAVCTGVPLIGPRPSLEDPRMWVDGCGGDFFVEAPTEPGIAARIPGRIAARRSHAVRLRNTFALESRPGADRTLYLQFTGATLEDTAWNTDYGLPSITLAPFSLSAPADTSFSSTELLQIQRAWQVTAEDFAPFDVNVTTRPPAPDALERSTVDDQTYGATVLVTNGGPLLNACQCGGLAYAGVFSAIGAGQAFHQPALVFGARNGFDIGEAVSHEAGHTFGLMHDGTPTDSYYGGRTPWAPIMGASYGEPVTQWSQGEYPHADNPQDDLAVIAAGAPLRADDHGDTAATATPLLAGTPVAGIISTRTDVDAFTFTAAGRVRITAAPTSAKADLDIGLRILDASGATVAQVNPAVRAVPSGVAGLDATWAPVLPAVPATYTAVVDGVGSGSPLTPGQYSDYASLGRYRITLTAR
jgi:hypothetical protein